MRSEFLINRQGKQFVLFAGLLNEAHARGIKSIQQELLQVPHADNEHLAVVKARVEMADGTVWENHGDASPESVGKAIRVHILRMAATRAVARCLRDCLNIGATSLEELGEEEPGDVSPAATPRQSPRQSAQRKQGADNVRAIDPKPANAARKSQLDMLRTLAEELRGENGVERLEARIGKPLAELSRDEANEWISRLTPAEQGEA